MQSWALKAAELFNLSIFPSTEDAAVTNISFCKAFGETFPKSDPCQYLPPHTDTVFYTNTPTDDVTPEIVFIGNDFQDRFPNGNERRKMVQALQSRYGDRFGVYGYGWDGTRPVSSKQERMLYSNAKIAINHNHVHAPGYTSDRMMRAMSCGATMLTSSIENGIPGLVSGHDYFEWSTVDELIDKIDMLLGDEVLCSLVAANGRRSVSAEYSWDRFVEKVIEMSELY